MFSPFLFGTHPTDLGGFPQDSNDSVVGAAHEDQRQDEDENLKFGKDGKYFAGAVGGVKRV